MLALANRTLMKLAAAGELILLGSGLSVTILAAFPCVPRLDMHIFKDHSALPAGAHAKSPSHATLLVEADLSADVGADVYWLPTAATLANGQRHAIKWADK